MIQKIYKQATKEILRIVNNQYKDATGVTWYIDRLTDKELNNIGINRLASVDVPIILNHQKLSDGVGVMIDNLWVIPKVAVNIPIEELKTKKLQQLTTAFESNTRPRVPLTLEDTTAIFIDGGRADKDNFKEEYDRMVRNAETVGVIKDADNIKRVATAQDVYNGYIAIVDYYAPLMKGKWQIEDVIASIVIDPVGTYPTYTDAVDALDSIVI